MAKKLFHDRVKASMCPVYEDISDDEFDPTEIQIVEKPYDLSSVLTTSEYKYSDQSYDGYFVDPISTSTFMSSISSDIINGIVLGKDNSIKPSRHFKGGDGKNNLTEAVKHDPVDQDEFLKCEVQTGIKEETQESDVYGSTIDGDKHYYEKMKVNEVTPSKTKDDEELLAEWSGNSDSYISKEQNEESATCGAREVNFDSQLKEIFSLKISENLFQKECKLDDRGVSMKSTAQQVPFFYVEQKDLLAEPWRITTTPQKISLTRKKNAREKTEQFDCPHCSRKYWKNSKLREHIRINHFEKMKKVGITDTGLNYKFQIAKCPECKKQLKTKTDMYVHRLTHLIPGFTNMECPLCAHSQYTYNTLKHHMRTEHKLEEKWFCPVCPDSRTFTQNHSLLIHISNFHFHLSKEVPEQFPCKQCHKQFGSKALMGRHVNSTHLAQPGKHYSHKMFKCEACENDYGSFVDLKKHIRTKHVLAQESSVSKVDFASKLSMFKKSMMNNSWSRNPSK